MTVIAWLWARTVNSPNPAFTDVAVPLASTFMLSTKKGKEAYVEPVIEGHQYRFGVNVGAPKNPETTKLGTTAGKRQAFRCLMSDVPIPYEHIRSEGKAGRMGSKLMAIVAEGDRGRVYLEPMQQHELIARRANPVWRPEVDLPNNPRDFKTPNYGLPTYADLFTPRQLSALTTFSDLIATAIDKVKTDYLEGGIPSLPSDERALRDGGTGATAYAEAVGVYLGFLVDQQTNQSSTICGWNNINQQMIVTFSRQAIPMVWDFAECNILSRSTGSFWNLLDRQAKGISSLAYGATCGDVIQSDAVSQQKSLDKVISTDPPYYDNIGYADLSDFFYVWLRRSLRPIFPELFATLAVPKSAELIATPYRHDSKDQAEAFFLEGMTHAMQRLARISHQGSIQT